MIHTLTVWISALPELTGAALASAAILGTWDSIAVAGSRRRAQKRAALLFAEHEQTPASPGLAREDIEQLPPPAGLPPPQWGDGRTGTRPNAAHTAKRSRPTWRKRSLLETLGRQILRDERSCQGNRLVCRPDRRRVPFAQHLF